jgi:membrane protease YdiL (CAAX protease family)
MLEPLFMFGLILAYIWKLRFIYPSCWIVIPVLMLLSHLIRRESPRALGFRTDNLTDHLKEFALLLIPIVLALLAGGAWFHTFRRIGFDDILLSLAAYLPWGLVQEYALNGYFLNRFDQRLSRRAASVLAALLFCAAHAPNYFLMAVTLPLAWCATVVYRRTRNLYVLGVAHAIIGLMLFLVVPDSISHHLRVGPGYLQFHHVHLRGPGAVAGEGDLGFIRRPGRVRVSPLRTIDGVGGGFHPT